jgi:hypothetical protein
MSGLMGVDLKSIRERLDRAKATGALIGVDHETTLALLEHIEGLEAHVALLKASLKQATKAEERAKELEEALRAVSDAICLNATDVLWMPRGQTHMTACEFIDAALSTERMPSDG